MGWTSDEQDDRYTHVYCWTIRTPQHEALVALRHATLTIGEPPQLAASSLRRSADSREPCHDLEGVPGNAREIEQVELTCVLLGP